MFVEDLIVIGALALGVGSVIGLWMQLEAWLRDAEEVDR